VKVARSRDPSFQGIDDLVEGTGTLEKTVGDDSLEETGRDLLVRVDPVTSPESFAYVSLFFGECTDVFAGLMVTGYSLRVQFQTSHALVLLHTSDVPDRFLRALRELYTLRLVEDVPFGGSHISRSSRPELWRTFGKLRAMELTEFSKILFLDADLLVRRSLDALFEIATPAGVEVNSEDPHGAPVQGFKIPRERLMSADGVLRARVNAGVLLLSPSHEAFEQLAEKALLGTCCDSCCPEEDLLTRHWAHSPWKSLGAEHNFEMWRMYSAPAGAAESAAIFHFSARWAKPYWAAFENCSDQEAFLQTKEWVDNAFKWDPHNLFPTATVEWLRAFRTCAVWCAVLGHDLLGLCGPRAHELPCILQHGGSKSV